MTHDQLNIWAYIWDFAQHDSPKKIYAWIFQEKASEWFYPKLFIFKRKMLPSHHLTTKSNYNALLHCQRLYVKLRLELIVFYSQHSNNGRRIHTNVCPIALHPLRFNSAHIIHVWLMTCRLTTILSFIIGKVHAFSVTQINIIFLFCTFQKFERNIQYNCNPKSRAKSTLQVFS